MGRDSNRLHHCGNALLPLHIQKLFKTHPAPHWRKADAQSYLSLLTATELGRRALSRGGSLVASFLNEYAEDGCLETCGVGDEGGLVG